jgi:hypothetical protein
MKFKTIISLKLSFLFNSENFVIHSYLYNNKWHWLSVSNTQLSPFVQLLYMLEKTEGANMENAEE